MENIYWKMISALAEFVLYSEPAAGEFPLDVGIRAADPAGTALKAAFIHNPHVPFVPNVDSSRAEDCAGLATGFLAFFAHLLVDDGKVAGVVDLESGCIQFVFNFAHLSSYLTELIPRRPSIISFQRPTFFLMLVMIIFCFCFLGTPSTLSISSTASPTTSGSVLKIIGFL